MGSMGEPAHFTCRSARSSALLGGLLLAIAAETAVLHVWLSSEHRAMAWTLTTLSVLTAAWLVGDFRAMGRSTIGVDAKDITLRVAWRADASLSRTAITTATRATWREIPPPGTALYLNLTKPADPNVLLTFDPPVSIRLAGGLRRRASTLGLCLDNPDAFVGLLTHDNPTG